MEHENLLDDSEILVRSTPEESPGTFSKRIIDRFISSRRVTETVNNIQEASFNSYITIGIL